MKTIGPRLFRRRRRRLAVAERISARLSHLLAGMMVATALAIPLRAAATPPDPMVEIKATVDQVISVLNNPALKANATERRRQLKDVVAAHFDFAEMARLTLGVHWKELSEQQRKDFVDLFTRFIEASYISRIERYGGEQIDYRKESIEAPDHAQVNSNIVLEEGKEPIGLNYRCKLENGDWKVFDVTVDNISIVANYRNQFSRVINNRGFDELMSDMRSKQEGLDARIAN